MTTSPVPTLPPDCSLLETLRLEHGLLVRLERHLARARLSAAALGFAWREPEVRTALATLGAAHPEGVYRVRLLVDALGTPTLACTPHSAVPSALPWRVAFADQPVDDRDPRLRHKTTAREPYEAARRSRPDVDDVLLWNGRNEVTESTIANVVAELEGKRYTPALTSGLLAGTFRGELLDEGRIEERVLARGTLSRASRLWLVNSLRGWVEATLVR